MLDQEEVRFRAYGRVRSQQITLYQKLPSDTVDHKGPTFDIEIPFLFSTVLDQEETRIHGVRAAHGAEDADSEDESVRGFKDDPSPDSDADDLDDTDHDKFFDAADDFVEADKVRKTLSRKNLPEMLEEAQATPPGKSKRVVRRKALPAPAQEERSASLWSIIKDNVGKDLQKVCLPVYFNEPISALQKCAEDLEYSELLDKAYEAGRAGDPLSRVLYVAAFAVSGYAATEGRTRKPFNPLLGETYEAERPEQGIRFVSEKVSHHPTIVACHCEGRGWRFYGDSNVKSKFWGRSIQVDPVGILTLEFADGEVFQWSKVRGGRTDLGQFDFYKNNQLLTRNEDRRFVLFGYQWHWVPIRHLSCCVADYCCTAPNMQPVGSLTLEFRGLGGLLAVQM